MARSDTNPPREKLIVAQKLAAGASIKDSCKAAKIAVSTYDSWSKDDMWTKFVKAIWFGLAQKAGQPVAESLRAAKISQSMYNEWSKDDEWSKLVQRVVKGLRLRHQSDLGYH